VKRKVLLTVVFESDSKKYEDYKAEHPLELIYIDGKYSDKDGKERNLVVEWGQKLVPIGETTMDDIWWVQETIVEAALQDDGTVLDIKETFSDYVPFEERPKLTTCPFDHESYLVDNYHELGFPQYFDQEDANYGHMAGSECRGCNKVIVHKWVQGMDKNLQWCCSNSHPVWVCNGLYQAQHISSCRKGGVVCKACWDDKLATMGRASRRRKK